LVIKHIAATAVVAAGGAAGVMALPVGVDNRPERQQNG
jgi:hypothetical protein